MLDGQYGAVGSVFLFIIVRDTLVSFTFFFTVSLIRFQKGEQFFFVSVRGMYNCWYSFIFDIGIDNGNRIQRKRKFLSWNPLGVPAFSFGYKS